MEFLGEGKQTLLGALEQIERIEAETGASVRHVCVVYSIYGATEGQVRENTGWSTSAEPSWLIAALLRRAADGMEEAAEENDEE